MRFPPPARTIQATYEDPLDLVWLRAARDLGFVIARAPDVYASFDGARTISLTPTADFDPDDSLAQLIFHELCHAIVSAPEGLTQIDWGLDATSDRDLDIEHATHRLQAHLADRWGLRAFFAATTVWRPHWDRLPKDPLAEGDDPAIAIARAARVRADEEPWASALRRAFVGTQTIAAVVRKDAPPDSIWARVPARVHERHPMGPHLGPIGARCASCAWARADDVSADTGGDAPNSTPAPPTRCEMLRRGTGDAPTIDAAWPACQHWEPRLDEAACAACGACCRQAFHLVPIAPDEPLVRARPDLVTYDTQGASPYFVPRPNGFCAALAAPRAPYRCAVYDQRPASCRDFELGGPACLEARQRCELSGRP